eukprot:1557972-Amphidinium_carterae.1
MQMADLLSYNVHAKLAQAYTTQLLRDDVPPRYTSVTWRQLQLADAELWRLVGNEMHGALCRPEDGSRPLDSVQHYIQPLLAAPVSHAPRRSASSAARPGLPQAPSRPAVVLQLQP